ncbi:MAG TPA: S8 family serine peptidase, partial [Longimicrobiales bacterium]|nr:S8 family serine peptidase [Longimicrobiales bacterium]
MRRSILGLLGLLLVAAPARSQDARLDASLRVLRGLAGAGAPALRADPVPTAPLSALPGLAALSAGPAGTEVRLLLRLAPGEEARVEALGGRIGVRAGDVVTARVPLAALDALAADPALFALEGAALLSGGAPPTSAFALTRPAAHGPVPTSPFALTRPLPISAPSALTERSMEDAGAGRVHPRVGSAFTGAAGRGVIVGIYDSGVDLDHPDFQEDALGRAGSRVLYAWDQTAEVGSAPGMVGGDLFDYGHECGPGALEGCPMRDVWGHGTHVAGIAAGDGSATGNGQAPFRFTGVAPAADLIVVKGGDRSFSADRVLEGVAYIFARAAELGRPAVVNLSLGSQAGPHDGTTLFERALDALVGPGRILVTIAGNAGTNANETPAFVRAPAHAMGTLATGQAGEHGLVVPGYRPNDGAITDGAVLELWYPGEDSLDVEVRTPSGMALRVATGDTALARFAEGAVFVDNAFGGPQATNGDRLATLVLFDADAAAPPAPGTWTVRVEGMSVRSAGEYHLWLVGATFAALGAATRLSGGHTNSHLVTAPGSAERAIAVAAHVTRHEWLNGEGRVQRFPVEEPLGDIAFFSSPGPRRDGALRPHLSAPGKMVISAAAPDAGAFRQLPWLEEADGRHVALLGTSMSAPHVTGAVALLLEQRPGLGPEEARDLLTASARSDAFTAHPHTGGPDGVPNPQWGHGKLDVEAALRSLGLPAGDLRVTATPLARVQAVRPVAGTQLPLLALDFSVG